MTIKKLVSQTVFIIRDKTDIANISPINTEHPTALPAPQFLTTDRQNDALVRTS